MRNRNVGLWPISAVTVGCPVSQTCHFVRVHNPAAFDPDRTTSGCRCNNKSAFDPTQPHSLALNLSYSAAEARQIQIPTRVLHARDDQSTPLDAGKELAAIIPLSRFSIVERGHREGTASTSETRQLVLDFLSEVE